MRAPVRARVTIPQCVVAGVALAVSLTGCATLRATVGGYATGPDGISRPQQNLRQAVERGDFAAVLAWHEDDALLRALNTGVASYYASQFARSAAVLDTAALVADDRITASVSKDALSLVTNDMARPYQPRRTERVLIPYYGLLAYARLGAWEDAAVEARRIVLLLAQYADDRDDSERSLHAALGYLAAATFERAGNHGEAEVAYRAAHALAATLPDRPAAPPPGYGELLVVVERGFVAHRTTETMGIVLRDDERDSLGRDDDTQQRVLARAAARVAGRGSGWPTGGWEQRPVVHVAGKESRAVSVLRILGGHDDDDDGDDDKGDDWYRLTIAFPALRRSERAWPGQLRLADDSSATAVQWIAMLDDASAADERRDRVAMATRAVARAAAKYAMTKLVKDKKGDVAGHLANIGASLLERADVRSWHLLPQEIVLLRVPAPPGTREMRLQIGEGAGTRMVSLGPITVRSGEVTIAPIRLWRNTGTASSVPVLAAAQ